MEKKCTKCGKIKIITEYYVNKSSKLGYKSQCKICENQRDKLYRLKNPRLRNKEDRRVRVKKYGITLDKYIELFNFQNGCCAICRRSEKDMLKSLCIDHNHLTGKIRGLLCHNCNNMLGHAKDDFIILENAILYLNQS